MSIFEIFAVKNTPTYIASKELSKKLLKSKEADASEVKKEISKEDKTKTEKPSSN